MKKGISLLALGIILFIMIILTAVIVIESLDSVKSVNKTRFITEYMLIESAAEKYYLKNNTYPTISSITLTVASNAAPDQFVGESISNGTLALQKLDISQFGYDDLTFGVGDTATDYFAVSTSTGRVYYVDGFTHDEQVYYMTIGELSGN